MNPVLSCSLALASLLYAAPSFAGLEFRTVDYPGSSQTILFAVNDDSRMVGQYTDPSNATHAFTLRGDQFEAIDPGGVVGTSATSHAYSLNNVGDIAGSYADASGVLHGYVLHGGEVLPVEYPGGYPTEAYGINDLGQVIGVYYTPDGNLHAFELDHGVYEDEEVAGALSTIPLSIDD